MVKLLCNEAAAAAPPSPLSTCKSPILSPSKTALLAILSQPPEVSHATSSAAPVADDDDD